MPTIDEVLLDNLTGAQRAAAVDPAKEVLTLACAGSGKSRTLAYRIAYLMANQQGPSSIVAFTFTDKAAETIKLRVAEALFACGQSPTAIGAMYIGTIHSYCQTILGEMNARYRQFDVLDDNRLKLYLISRYTDLHLRPLRARARGQSYFDTIRQVANAWKTMNDEMLELADISADDPELGQALEALRAHLDADEFIDFSLMIRLAVEAIRNGDPGAQRAVRNLRHLMVDEYQDVNPAQEALIRELHAGLASMFVVGDDDQSIFAWRGADVSNILTFHDRYPDCSQHTLSRNHRSTPAIVSTADQFVAAELGANRIPKHPDALEPPGPRHFGNLWFPSRPDEAQWVAERIHTLLETEFIERDGDRRGLTPADFAILMRSTREPEQTGEPRHSAFTNALDGLTIPYTLESGGSIFDRPQVRTLSGAFTLLRNGSPDRDAARQFFEGLLRPTFPDADFNDFASVLAEWGRLIHAPIEGARRRVFPQRLVHDLLRAFSLHTSHFDPGTMQDLGVFSRMIQDVETVYLSIDSARRFQDILNFIDNLAEVGYDSSTEDVFRRPDTVTVSTVHKAKGLEFPVVFVVDAESQRFPGKRRLYEGWLPTSAIQPAVNRGAYQSTREEQIRLFYTSITRAERFLYVTGCQSLPGGKSIRRPSPFSQRLVHPEITKDPLQLPPGLAWAEPRRRIDETIVPTSYSDIRYFLRCPRDYQFRKSFGFSPPIPELFGFGKTVHTSIEKLHEVFSERAPSAAEAQALSDEVFHLKHVYPSNSPELAPGPYERAKAVAASIVGTYAEAYADDFTANKQLEVRFEVPVSQAVINGSIDLMLRYDETGQLVAARVIDFKAIEGGDHPEQNEDLHWTELALQVQLYAKAARDVLGENARTGAVHLLKDNQRIEVPVTEEAVDAAIRNVEWAVDRIIEGDFPMRPFQQKCEACDFQQLCPKTPQHFEIEATPPPIHLPQGALEMPRAFSEFTPG